MAKTGKAAAPATSKPLTKSQIVRYVAEHAELTHGQVADVFESLERLIKRELGRKGPGVFNLAGLLKVRLATKAATKAREGRNPFTGETIMIKAKPARRTVRVSALKKLKDMAGGAAVPR
ncbi:MAG TPA: HU family DNA-binding protein, partial [Gammaproteobacteria bacterium]|nr:HU family DNA-binding protein [Gammaproteobacteria bacterium]